MNRTVYNPRIVLFEMLIFLLRFLRALGLLLLIGLLGRTSLAYAADWSDPEAQLASKIAAATGPGAVALDIVNRSSLAQADLERISHGLRTRLAAAGLRLVTSDQAAATVRITLSEDLRNYVWIAEIHQGSNESSVVMVSMPRAGALAPTGETSAILIHKALLWTQSARILDVAVIDGNPTHMAVLDAERVAIYRLQGARWQAEQSLALSHSRPWPRDLRGRLVLRQDHLLDVYLPGVVCGSSGKAPLVLACSESDDPWPLGTEPAHLSAFFTPVRNYFTGALTPGVGKQTAVTAFYSAAPLPREKYTLWLFAAVDGQLHLLDGVSDQATASPWGSDLASVRNACGAGWDVLATSAGNGENDAIQAYDFADRGPVAVSQPVEFNGPITGLWTETNGNAAVAISRNAQTGNYEAFRLSFNCGQ
jgi:hypothetical protein